jgi:ferredoxin
MTATPTASTKAVHRDARTRRSVASAPREPTADTLRLMVTVRVDADLCVGHGRCYVLAPDVFGADDFGHCIVLEEQVGAGLEAQARMGAENCPEQAITIEP